MAYSMALRDSMRYNLAGQKKKQKITVDGKTYDISEFDDTHWWESPKKRRKIPTRGKHKGGSPPVK